MQKCSTHPPCASPTLQPIRERFGSPLKRGTTENKHQGHLLLKGIFLECVVIYCIRPKCFYFHVSNSVIIWFRKIIHSLLLVFIFYNKLMCRPWIRIFPTASEESQDILDHKILPVMLWNWLWNSVLKSWQTMRYKAFCSPGTSVAVCGIEIPVWFKTQDTSSLFLSYGI